MSQVIGTRHFWTVGLELNDVASFEFRSYIMRELFNDGRT
jgi:hypothetical protein